MNAEPKGRYFYTAILQKAALIQKSIRHRGLEPRPLLPVTKQCSCHVELMAGGESID